ncbi:MAG: uroporphyrinogen decarboxylase, partial [Acidimicrobiales bacterium]|nr:uroporphyrinogen decarboxylase [Acidimicrobiales bacterium]
EAGADVIGVDWRVSLTDARRRIPEGRSVQGNLDPAICLAEWPVVAEQTRRVLADNDGRPGHIFNLGHGVTPDIDPAILERVVDLVHTA